MTSMPAAARTPRPRRMCCRSGAHDRPGPGLDGFGDRQHHPAVLSRSVLALDLRCGSRRPSAAEPLGTTSGEALAQGQRRRRADRKKRR